MANRTTFIDGFLERVARAGRILYLNQKSVPTDIVPLCELLLSDRGDATSLAIAQQVHETFEAMDQDDRDNFFVAASDTFGVDMETVSSAVAAWTPDSMDSTRRLHVATEPRSQELIRRLNRPPGGTESLVRMRSALLDAVGRHPGLATLDADFRHLFRSWFNRGFLELRRIDWSTSAEVLEKIISYEAVHEIAGWDDLRQRVAAPDRRLYAFFHPALLSEPLIFVEVALTRDIPTAITPILSIERQTTDPASATNATFYSISNCQKGLRGVSFGSFLIKQVVEELAVEFSQLRTFATLSPVPGLRRWVEETATRDDEAVPAEIKAMALDLSASCDPDTPKLPALAAYYLLRAKNRDGAAADPVAHFHLGNGASLHQINAGANTGERGLSGSYGVMVNYLYDRSRIEENHENYANDARIAQSGKVAGLLGRL